MPVKKQDQDNFHILLFAHDISMGVAEQIVSNVIIINDNPNLEFIYLLSNFFRATNVTAIKITL